MKFGGITAEVVLLEKKKINLCLFVDFCGFSVVQREWRTLEAKRDGVSVRACYNKCVNELTSVTSINLSICYCMACLRLVA